MVELDSPSQCHLTVHRLVPVLSRLLRRRRCGHHEVEQRRGDLDHSGLVLPTSVDLLLHDRRMHCRGRTRDRSDHRRCHLERSDAAIGTELSGERVLPRFASPALQSESVESRPSIIGTSEWNHMDRSGPAFRECCLTAVSCAGSSTCVRGWHCRRVAGRTCLSTVELQRLDARKRHLDPFGIAAQSHRLHERDHLRCRWYEPQLDSLRHQHVEQRFDVVTPEPARERS